MPVENKNVREGTVDSLLGGNLSSNNEERLKQQTRLGDQFKTKVGSERGVKSSEEKPVVPVGDDITEEAAKELRESGVLSQKEIDFGVLTVGHIARICHEANKVLCESLGDTSQVGWDSAPAWQKESAISGVKKHLSGEITSPMDSHASWMKEKYDDGWKYGEVKDAEAKIHPCLVPYATLPPEQQSKDFLFSSICQGLGLFVKRGV